MNGGRLPERGAPKTGEENVWVGTTIVWLYRKAEHGVELLFQKRSPYVDRNPNNVERNAKGDLKKAKYTLSLTKYWAKYYGNL